MTGLFMFSDEKKRGRRNHEMNHEAERDGEIDICVFFLFVPKSLLLIGAFWGFDMPVCCALRWVTWHGKRFGNMDHG